MELVSFLIIAFAVAVILGSASGIARLAGNRGEADALLDEDVDAAALGDLAERKEMVMQLILSTELDHQTGKISDEDREKTVTRLKREAVAIMKRMDALGGTDEDVARAEQDLAGHIGTARAAAGDRRWSAAARLRHGGNAPSEVSG